MNLENFDVFDPFDLNSSDFNCDLYLNKVICENKLDRTKN